MSERERLPDERPSITHHFTVGSTDGYLNVGLYPDGRPGELFIRLANGAHVQLLDDPPREESNDARAVREAATLTISALLDEIAMATSVALQHGMPLRTLADKFMHTRFPPYGLTSNPEIRFAKSIPDYCFQWLMKKFPDGRGAP